VRILHVIYDDIDNPWVGGGGATRTLEIYSRIAAKGHRVVVVCGRYPGVSTRQIRRGVTYRHLGASASYVWSRLTFMYGAARLIKGRGYDIVIEDVSPFSPVGAPLWCGPIPSVASVQNLSGRHAVAKYGVMGVGPRIVEGPLLSLFKNFIAVSTGIAKELKERHHAKTITVIPNSVGEGFRTSGANPVYSDDGPYILSLGRIDVYQKGLDRLIAAFDIVASQAPEVRLLIAGDGTAAQVGELRRLVAEARHGERITLLGKASQVEAANLMKGAELLAMPSRYEAWPIAAIEAGVVGTPVVGADVTGVRDAAPPFPRGHSKLVDGDDREALAGAMLSVLNDNNLHNTLSKAGQAWASRFSWDNLADKQLSFYLELISKTINPK